MPRLTTKWTVRPASVAALTITLLSPTPTPAADRTEQITRAARDINSIPASALEDDKARVTVTGTVRTEDGAPLPADAEMYAHARVDGASTHMALGRLTATFSHHTPPGTIWLSVTADGYAPAAVGPFNASPASTLPNIDIVLKRGITGRLHLVGPNGEPVKAADLSGYTTGEAGVRVWHWTPGPDGVVTIPHATPDEPYRFSLRAPGYQQAELRDARLSADHPLTWQILAAHKTDGVVTGADGKPIAGATLRQCAQIRGSSVETMEGWNGPLLATTDANGHYSLDTLQDGFTYAFFVRAPDGRLDLVRDITPGQSNHHITLGDGIRVRGRIPADLLPKLEKRKRKPVVAYHQTAVVLNNAYGDVDHYAPVTIDGDGEDGRFEISHLIPGPVRISIPSASKQIQLTPDQTEVLVDFSPANLPPKRKVTVTFKSDTGQPARPTGTVTLQSYLGTDNRIDPIIKDPVEVKDGQAHGEAYVNGRLFVGANHLVGHFVPDFQCDVVPPGDGDFHVEVPAIESGAILAHILDPDGHPTSGHDLQISVNEVSRSPRLPQGTSWHGSYSGLTPHDGSVLTSPLPLDGIYHVEVHDGFYCTESDPVPVDAKRPLPQVDVRLTKGVPADVQILDDAGHPIPGVPVALTYEAPHRSHGWSPHPLTDPQGRAHFENLNPAATNGPDGRHYTVTVEPATTYQPADPVTVHLDGTPTTLRLAKGHVVTGRLLDKSTGWPIAGAEIYATAPDAPHEFHAEAPTDDHGSFRFSTLPPAQASLHVRQSRSFSSNENLVDPTESTAPIEIKTEIPDWERNQVRFIQPK